MTAVPSRADLLAALRLPAAEAVDLFALGGLWAVVRTILDRAEAFEAPGLEVALASAVEAATVEALRLARVEAARS